MGREINSRSHLALLDLDMQGRSACTPSVCKRLIRVATINFSSSGADVRLDVGLRLGSLHIPIGGGYFRYLLRP